MQELKTIKLIFTDNEEYKKLGEDCKIITTSLKLINEIKLINDYGQLLKFLDKSKGLFVEANGTLTSESFKEIDYRKSFTRYCNALLETDIESTDTIEEYLIKLDFIKNDWGFLTGIINNVTYTLMHDPLNGYALQCNSMQKRVFEDRMIPLGRNPTLEELKECFCL